MKNEEAIRILDPETSHEALWEYMDGVWNHTQALMLIGEAQKMGLAALRAQQDRPLDRSRCEGCEMCSTQWTQADWADGGAHDFRIDGDTLFYFDEQFGWEGIKIKYCPFCGRPLTEKAWAELERRIGGNDGTANIL